MYLNIALAFCLVILLLITYYFYPESKLPEGVSVNKIIVQKSKHRMMVYHNNRLLKTYIISLGKQPIGAKEFEGDMKTPEGCYIINDRNPNSRFHKNLGISYPNTTNMSYAQRLGKSAGGAIKIHGLRNRRGVIGKFHRWKDWTHGCIAVTNNEIDELYNAVVLNCPIEIYP